MGSLAAMLVLGLGVAAGAPDGSGGARASRETATEGTNPRGILLPFEDEAGPCHFFDATPLRDRYAERGVTFAGPGDGDGGAILGDCSKFGVEGYGGYRFLAFNRAARLAGGGVPEGPETLEFAWPVQKVELLAGSPAPGSVTLTCFDAGGTRAGSAGADLSPTLQPLTVTGTGMVRCEIAFDAAALVLDNLQFTPQDPLPIPAATPLSVAVLVVLLALAGSALLRAP